MDLFQRRHWQRIALAVGLQIAIAQKEQVAFHPDRWAAVANTDPALAAGCYHGIYPGCEQSMATMMGTMKRASREDERIFLLKRYTG